ncbi:DUF1289 domain-containing protein [Motilimonas cestriensis]|uniref:DUF1289 domain-containing protein n=1 Tax=Motilimonas cestriensis TaxID=2742685 RepID=A0ABS8W8K8_9GAMM|nr:DUF1289 domain-containing protein [Motilimonas cestriensis]MCE2594096.1 DUF1289 domain-containing protein [Motilimonas cestriensis]
MSHFEVKSPCVRNCCLNEQDICLGCHRSLDEIIAWHDSNDSEKEKILNQAKQRALQIGQKNIKF